MPKLPPFDSYLDKRLLPRRVEVTGSLAIEAAALLAISGDMKEAAQWLRLVATQEDEMVASACRMAGTMTYARCFNKGTRKSYSARVPIPTEYRSAHTAGIDWRNQYLAHADPGSAGEVAMVALILPPVGTRFPIEATCQFTRAGAISSRGIERQAELAEYLRDRNEALGQELLTRIAELADELPIGDLRAKADGRGTVHVGN
jgi:TPR repeat protein